MFSNTQNHSTESYSRFSLMDDGAKQCKKGQGKKKVAVAEIEARVEVCRSMQRQQIYRRNRRRTTFTTVGVVAITVGSLTTSRVSFTARTSAALPSFGLTCLVT